MFPSYDMLFPISLQVAETYGVRLPTFYFFRDLRRSISIFSIEIEPPRPLQVSPVVFPGLPSPLFFQGRLPATFIFESPWMRTETTMTFVDTIPLTPVPAPF